MEELYNFNDLHMHIVTGKGRAHIPKMRFLVARILCFHWKFQWGMLLKGLITVGMELRQQVSDLLSDAGTSPPDNKSFGCCCCNSRLTVINPDYNMTKQLCMKRIYSKICSKSSSDQAASLTCLHCDVTHLSLTTGVVALHIPLWRAREREEHRQARKTVSS